MLKNCTHRSVKLISQKRKNAAIARQLDNRSLVERDKPAIGASSVAAQNRLFGSFNRRSEDGSSDSSPR
jgi:hypothetical protein